MYRIPTLSCVVLLCASGCEATENVAISIFVVIAIFGVGAFTYGIWQLVAVQKKLGRMLSDIETSSISIFAKQWRQDSLVRGVFRDTTDERDVLTDRIEEFDLDWVMSRIGVSRVCVEQIPPAFTAFGIFFTFVGLTQGIDNLDPTAGTEQLMLGMTSLLAGVSTAFYSSMIGIALSVATLLIAKGFQQSVRTRAAKLRDNLVVQTDKANSPEATLLRLKSLTHQNLDVNREVSSKMGSLGTDIKTALEPLLKELIGDELKSLNTSMQDFTKGSSEAHSAALDGVMTDFIEKFNESLGGQFDELGRVLEETLKWHASTQSALQSTIASFESMKTDQAEAMTVERELLEVRLASEKRQVSQLDGLVERADELTRNLEGVMQSLDKTAENWSPLGSAIERGAVDLEQSVSSLQARLATLETLVGDFDQNLNASSDQLRNLAVQIRSELEDGFSQTFKDFDGATAEVVDRLNASYVNLKAAVADLDETLKTTRRVN